MLKNSIKTKRCPRCRTRCRSLTKIKREKESELCIVFAPKNIAETTKNEEELKVRLWAFMRPPRISDPTPAINPVRLEKVKDLLNNESRDKALESKVDSDLSIQILPDGSVRKVRSMKEVKIYPPMMQMKLTKKDKFCKPDCASATEDEINQMFASCPYRPGQNKK